MPSRTIAFAAALLAACGAPEPADPAASETPDAGVTWFQDVRPVVQTRCADCHSPGQVAPFSFDDWETVEALAPSMVASVEAGTMPPYAFDQDCRTTDSHLVLSEAEVELLQAWRDAGYPAGDPATAADAARSGPPTYPPFDLEVRPLEPITVDLTRADDYRCVVTDTVLAEDTWLIGDAALIDNEDVVHHLIYYTVPASAEADLLALDAASEAPGIPCYERAGYGFWELDGLDSFGGWAPGYQTWHQDPDADAPLSGVFVEAGSRIVIEGHFNSLNASSDSVTDATGIGLWVLPTGQTPDLVLTGDEVADYRLAIPAGAVDHVEGGSLDIRSPRTLVSVNPHMHTLGTRMEATLVRADGSEECLTRVAPYDFDWQFSYAFSQPVQLEPGDRIDMTCHYDNSAANQPVIDGQPQEPRDVTYGEGTTDEMCIHYLTYSTPYAEWAAGR